MWKSLKKYYFIPRNTKLFKNKNFLFVCILKIHCLLADYYFANIDLRGDMSSFGNRKAVKKEVAM